VTSADRHSTLFRVVAGAVAVLFFVAFVALGTWQLKRRVWKLDLIARVEQRVHAPPVAPPAPDQWPRVAADEYRHLILTGTFLTMADTLAQAVTDLGAGYWVLTPLRTSDGNIVLVNRGFVPLEARNHIRPPEAGVVAVTGLLRLTEPGGGFLRHNAPAGDRWYSRDVVAMAQARGLTNVAPYFVDADAASGSRALADDSHASAAGVGAPASEPADGVAPVGGLTVIHFRNTHLVYAITWYTLALMVAGAIWLGVRNDKRA